TAPCWSSSRKSGTLSPTFGPVGTAPYNRTAASVIPSPYADSLMCFRWHPPGCTSCKRREIFPLRLESSLHGPAGLPSRTNAWDVQPHLVETASSAEVECLPILVAPGHVVWVFSER